MTRYDDDGVRCMMMRGGTSKGLYFLAGDLPPDPGERDDLLLRVLGTPDPRQIDGVGGADPLTSKVAVVSASEGPEADLDYLFLQVGVDQPTVSDRQTCGNLLAGIGPFAVERGLIAATGDLTQARIRLLNTGGVATARFDTPGGRVDYRGATAISGVPGTAAAVVLGFEDTAGSSTGSLLPTGRVVDVIDGIEVTCVDNGMPVVVALASDLGISGYETREELAADDVLRERVQSLRLQAGKLMGLGDVTNLSVPKVTLVARPRDGGALCTRTFIPVEPHAAIGVLGAVSVVTAALLPGGVAGRVAHLPATDHSVNLKPPTDLEEGVDHPSQAHLERPPQARVEAEHSTDNRVHDQHPTISRGDVEPSAGEQAGGRRRVGGRRVGGRVEVEHPTGRLQVEVELDLATDPPTAVRAANVRTARKLFDGVVFPRPRPHGE